MPVLSTLDIEKVLSDFTTQDEESLFPDLWNVDVDKGKKSSSFHFYFSFINSDHSFLLIWFFYFKIINFYLIKGVFVSLQIISPS